MNSSLSWACLRIRVFYFNDKLRERMKGMFQAVSFILIMANEFQS